MKEHINILEQHLQDIETASSLEDYVGSLRDFVKLIKFTPQLSPISKRFAKEKAYRYRPVQLGFRKMHIRIINMINSISLEIENNTHPLPQLACPLPISISLSNIQSPFFDAGKLYSKYTKEVYQVFENICDLGLEELINKQVRVTESSSYGETKKNIDLGTIREVHEAEVTLRRLRGSQHTEPWGYWKLVLQYFEWTNGGLDPSNHPFKRNLSNLIKSDNLTYALKKVFLHIKALSLQQNLRIAATAPTTRKDDISAKKVRDSNSKLIPSELPQKKMPTSEKASLKENTPSNLDQKLPDNFHVIEFYYHSMGRAISRERFDISPC